jgi:hypothetical protein
MVLWGSLITRSHIRRTRIDIHRIFNYAIIDTHISHLRA